MPPLGFSSRLSSPARPSRPSTRRRNRPPPARSPHPTKPPRTSATPSLEEQAAALPEPEPAPPVDAAAAAAAQPQTALATAVLLPVKGRAPKTGYDRDLYGQAWKDVDRNGCDTRNDILRRDLTDQVLKPGTNGCVVASGTLLDPYSGKPIAFVRGQDTSSAVQIDHVVALSDSWQKGAQQWDTAKREAFGNDPLNLLAADGPLNQQKGDGDTATWLPPNKAFRCAYVARQVGVKYTYGLWVTQAEQDAMVGVLSTCPTEPLPAGSAVPPLPVVEAPAVVVVPPVVEQPAAARGRGPGTRRPGSRPRSRARPGSRHRPVRQLHRGMGRGRRTGATSATPGTPRSSTATATGSGARSARDQRTAARTP